MQSFISQILTDDPNRYACRYACIYANVLEYFKTRGSSHNNICQIMTNFLTSLISASVIISFIPNVDKFVGDVIKSACKKAMRNLSLL